MKDKFNSFASLSRHKKEGIDFTIINRKVEGSTVTIVAPHAGMIEPGTREIAETAAANSHSLYIFDGNAATSDLAFAELHLTSTQFDEPRCLALVSKSAKTITIHGCADKEAVVYIGGLDVTLAKKLSASFNRHGIKALTQGHRFPALSPSNICNKNIRGQGVQLEFGRGIRDDADLLNKCAAIIHTCLAA